MYRKKIHQIVTVRSKVLTTRYYQGLQFVLHFEISKAFSERHKYQKCFGFSNQNSKVPEDQGKLFSLLST